MINHGKPWKRTIMGIEVISADGGVVWSWMIDRVQYSWCKAGWMMSHPIGGPPIRVMMSKLLEGAVGYSVGLHDGKGMSQRTNGYKVK